MEHVVELIGQLDSIGIKPTPEDQQEEVGEWEDIGDDEDGDGDIEMS